MNLSAGIEYRLLQSVSSNGISGIKCVM